MNLELKSILRSHQKKQKVESTMLNLMKSTSDKQMKAKILAHKRKMKTKQQSNLLRKVQDSSLKQIYNLAVNKKIATSSSVLDYKILKCAIKSRHRDLALFLLKNGCRVNKTDSMMTSPFSQTGVTPLHHAVGLNDKELVISLLAKGASVLTADKQGNTPLHVAFLTKRHELVKELLSFCCGAGNQNLANKAGISLMHIACTVNDPVIVQKFLAAGASINHFVDYKSSAYPGYTALHFAVEFRAAEVARVLVAANGNLDALDARGMSPRSLACKLSEEASLVDYLLTKGIRKTEAHNSNMLTTFHVVCLKEKPEVVEHFLHNGAWIEETVDCKDPFFALCTPLHMAVQSGDPDKVRLLVEYGACVESQNRDYMTPLHLALYTEDPEKIDKTNSIVDLLFSKFSFNNYDLVDLNGLSFLHIACSRNNVDLVKQMLKKEDINEQILYNLKNFALYTPLHFAVCYHAKETVELLVNSGANLNCSDNEQKKTRIEKIRPRTLDYIDLFCSRGCDVDAQDANWNTALHLASSSKNVKRDVVQELLKWGANVNLENSAGATPFDVAVHPHSLTIYDHVQKLLVANMPVSTHNQKSINNLSMSTTDLERARRRRQDCKLETLLLRNIYVDKPTSLLDVLCMDRHTILACYCEEDGAFNKIIESTFFEETFTNYACLLKLQYRRGAKARKAEESKVNCKKRKILPDDR
ncbi:uncharacterized protein LOC106647674 [Copidosoma floridanum]|uniref:uncharacterized protein LOC106647674 n=1 Tax=Copidosoma floridanum TaxID=29053 RepID=UPI0006C93E4D|nr:uncharacterized protein LOC106647674 [Copidosoma floridanum]